MDDTKKTVKAEKQKEAATRYADMMSSVQTFPGIKCLEAQNGNIVLRGRHGERDHIFTQEKAVDKYFDTVALVHKYALYGIRGWDTLKEIADDFKARIFEAVEQRKKLELSVPAKVLQFIQQETSKTL